MNYIAQRVKDLIKENKTSNPYELCDYLDITIIKTALPDKIYGFYAAVLGCKFIYLNEKLSVKNKPVVLAHEIGHAVLHPTLNSLFIANSTLFSQTKLEREADVFAAELLINDELFFDQEYEGSSLEQISTAINIPQKYVELKWQNMNNQI